MLRKSKHRRLSPSVTTSSSSPKHGCRQRRIRLLRMQTLPVKSRTMGTWHRGVLAISDALLGYMTGRENTTTWLFLNLDPYFYEKQDDETSWKVLEHFVKQQGQTVKPVFTSQKFRADTINQRLHIEEAASQGATIQSESKADTSADYVVDDRCVIPAEIKAMSKEELTEKIAEYEKTQKSLKNNEAEIKLPIHIV